MDEIVNFIRYQARESDLLSCAFHVKEALKYRFPKPRKGKGANEKAETLKKVEAVMMGGLNA